MIYLNTLIEKFWAGELNQDEKDMLVEMLEEKVTDFSDEEYKTFTDLINRQETRKNKKDEHLKKNLHAIETRLGFEHEQTPVYPIFNGKKLQWLAVACLIGIVFLGIFFWINNSNQENTKTQQPVTVVKEAWRVDTIMNTTDSTLTKILEDGTVVDLGTNSTISFYNPFDSLQRHVSLIGKATFHVTKDKKRPFIVYANRVTTTAIGTVFSVDATIDSLINVRLLEGRVVVRFSRSKAAPHETYLLPGEELKVNNLKFTYAKTTFKYTADKKAGDEIGKAIQKNDRQAVSLSFNRTPLNEVFDLIGKKYNVRIKYNGEALNSMSFTGSFLSTDSLKNILTIVCSTNDLAFTLESNTVTITK